MVLSNPAVSTTTGWPVGFWWSESTHPWLAFTERGYEAAIFSPEGGKRAAYGMEEVQEAVHHFDGNGRHVRHNH